MTQNLRSILVLFVLQLCMTAGNVVLADQYDEEAAAHDMPGAPVDERSNPDNHGSDAVFDKRLPPVFPGEEVRDGNKTMKVWSTSGPVHVERAPEPFRNYERESFAIGEDDLNVIVDGRPPSSYRNSGGQGRDNVGR